jgi:hypothetical protein
VQKNNIKEYKIMNNKITIDFKSHKIKGAHKHSTADLVRARDALNKEISERKQHPRKKKQSIPYCVRCMQRVINALHRRMPRVQYITVEMPIEAVVLRYQNELLP